MPSSDFLNQNLVSQCEDLAGEINKTYQGLPWALKHEAVSRLKRKVHELSQTVAKAKESTSRAQTEKYLERSLSLTHECVPLIDLCLRKNLASPELQARWTQRLNGVDKQLVVWLRASTSKKK